MREIRISNYTAIALLPVLIYSVVWSYFLIIQMDTFNVGMFDYGVAYNLLWKEAFNIPSYPSSVGYLPYMIATKLISFVLVPYMRLFPSTYNLLILQSIVIALPGLGLYFITKHITHKASLGLFVEMVWMLYYPNAGANGYPFHYITLFPLFYIFGFFFLIKNKVIYALIFFSLAAITDLLSPVILLFSIPMLVYSHMRFYKQYKLRNNTVMLFFIAAIVVVSSIILYVNYFISGIGLYSVHVGLPSSHLSFISRVLDELRMHFTNNFLYIVFMALPLLFSIILVNYRYFIATIPALLFYLLGGESFYFRFYYPGQHSSLISPILFIAFSIFLYKISTHSRNIFKIPGRTVAKTISSHKKSMIVILITILLLNAGLFAIYSPISPANQYMKTDFNDNPPADGGYGWYNNLSVSNYDSLLLEMMTLIPQNATVLGDFEMPQLADRYYFTYPGQYNPADPIDYAINNPRSGFFLVPVGDTGTDFFNYNEMELSNMFLENSSYGVYAQSEGAILFKHNYTGNPVFYVPLDMKISMNKINADTFSTTMEIISPGTYVFSVESSAATSISLFLGQTLLSTFNSTDETSLINIPTYVYSYFTAVSSEPSSHLTIIMRQIKPATHIDIYKLPIPEPTVYTTFSANLTYFSNVVVNNIRLNSSSFSYFYLINLTSYEDGQTIPEDVGNDAQIFSLNGNYPYVWNQIENTGYLEYGFRTENATISSYLQPIKIPVGTWLCVAATFHDGYVSLYLNGVNVFSAQIFPFGTSVGTVNNLMIGGAHPFPVNGEIAPNSNPLNASVADFVILNGSLSLEQIQNPQNLLNSLQENPNVVFSDWINVVTQTGGNGR